MEKKLLIYSNYRSLTTLLCLWMESLLPGYEITAVNDLQQALDLAQRQRFHAFVLNVSELTLTQVEAIGSMKSTNPDVPLVVLTNDDQWSGVKPALMAGADVCLSVDVFREQIFPILARVRKSEADPAREAAPGV